MFFIPLLALAFVGTAVVIGVFWNEIKSFLSSVTAKIKELALDLTVKGVRTFVQAGRKVKKLYNIAKAAITRVINYDPVKKQFTETTIVKEIQFEDIPDDIKSELDDGEEVDITEKTAQELHLQSA
ncbi:MAG: hypothetical protein K6F69_03690 [Treponema sp.]|nr:hypothetical protein [Treponema sp.]